MSITKEQILKAEGDVLSRLLGRILDLNDACQCHTQYGTTYNASRDMRSLFCVGCGGEVVPLNWDNAGKWWKWAIDTHGCEAFERAVAKLDASKRRYPFDPDDSDKLDAAISNIMLQCDPKDFLLIAALCKIGAKP